MDNVINLHAENFNAKMLRARDICQIFNIARSTVDNWARYGYLTRRKIGRNIFYQISEVERLKEIGA